MFQNMLYNPKKVYQIKIFLLLCGPIYMNSNQIHIANTLTLISLLWWTAGGQDSDLIASAIRVRKIHLIQLTLHSPQHKSALTCCQLAAAETSAPLSLPCSDFWLSLPEIPHLEPKESTHNSVNKCQWDEAVLRGGKKDYYHFSQIKRRRHFIHFHLKFDGKS